MFLYYNTSKIKLINNLFVEFMSNIREYIILCLSIVIEMIPINESIYLYL